MTSVSIGASVQIQSQVPIGRMFVLADEYPAYEDSFSPELFSNIFSLAKTSTPSRTKALCYSTVGGLGGPTMSASAAQAGLILDILTRGDQLPADLSEYACVVTVDDGAFTSNELNTLTAYYQDIGSLALFFGLGVSISLNPIIGLIGITSDGTTDPITPSISVSSQNPYFNGVTSLTYLNGNVFTETLPTANCILTYDWPPVYKIAYSS